MNPAQLCHYFTARHCLSCSEIEVPYLQQLKQKENVLKELFAEFQNVESAWLPPVESEQLAFRNKAKLSVTGSIERPIIGLTGALELDQGRELLSCPIHHPKLNEVIQALPRFVQDAGLTPYQIKSKTGELKGCILFYSEQTNQMYLRFVLRSKESIPAIQGSLPLLQKQFPFLVCITANIQPVPHAILEGKEEIYLTEIKSVQSLMNGISIPIFPQAFVQTNPDVAAKLYQTAADWMKELKIKNMVELFSGTGAFTLHAAPMVKEAVGIEINQDAVRSATDAAKKANLKNISFKCEDASIALIDQAPDLILVNPPRRGLAESIELIQKNVPEFLIYSSCNAETLVKDLKKIPQYKIKKIQIFDLFPHTQHFETLVLLQHE